MCTIHGQYEINRAYEIQQDFWYKYDENRTLESLNLRHSHSEFIHHNEYNIKLFENNSERLD